MESFKSKTKKNKKQNPKNKKTDFWFCKMYKLVQLVDGSVLCV